MGALEVSSKLSMMILPGNRITWPNKWSRFALLIVETGGRQKRWQHVWCTGSHKFFGILVISIFHCLRFPGTVLLKFTESANTHCRGRSITAYNQNNAVFTAIVKPWFDYNYTTNDRTLLQRYRHVQTAGTKLLVGHTPFHQTTS